MRLSPLATGSHTASATASASVDTVCPIHTAFVEVSSNSDFYYKRGTSATTSCIYAPAGGPYLIPMDCPVAPGVFSVIVTAVGASRVHVTPMG